MEILSDQSESASSITSVFSQIILMHLTIDLLIIVSSIDNVYCGNACHRRESCCFRWDLWIVIIRNYVNSFVLILGF